MTTEPTEAPFLVYFPRHPHFVGRDEDLERLHQALQDGRQVGVNQAGLTGMGGIGKTQLAVEYVYRYREHYPDGIYWLNAARPLHQEFAQLAERLWQGGEDNPNQAYIAHLRRTLYQHFNL